MIVSVHNRQCDMYGTVQYSTGDLTSWHSTMYNGKGGMDGGRKADIMTLVLGWSMVKDQFNAVLKLQISILGLEEWRC